MRAYFDSYFNLPDLTGRECTPPHNVRVRNLLCCRRNFRVGSKKGAKSISAGFFEKPHQSDSDSFLHQSFLIQYKPDKIPLEPPRKFLRNEMEEIRYLLYSFYFFPFWLCKLPSQAKPSRHPFHVLLCPRDMTPTVVSLPSSNSLFRTKWPYAKVGAALICS